jgi:DNA polymerase-3 subunit gamma/tau
LSSKLYEWTNDRWIISLSKKIGELSKKEKDIISKKKFLENAKRGEVYKKVLEIFPDAELIDIDVKQDEN